MNDKNMHILNELLKIKDDLIFILETMKQIQIRLLEMEDKNG